MPATENLFSKFNVGSYSTPSFGDVDEDGDLDMISGDVDGLIHYYAQAADTFAEKTAGDNPFDGIDIGTLSLPTLVNFDGDSDMDLVVGDLYGEIHYFANNSGTYIELTGGSNPWDGVDVGSRGIPKFIDYDEDGDLDMYVGEKYGTIHYFENDGGNFTEQTGGDNPFNNFAAVGSMVDFSPALIDQDGDGDLDIAIGTKGDGALQYYRNDGGGSYSELIGTNNPFEGIITNQSMTPIFVDLDDDGDMDIAASDSEGDIYYFQNEGSLFFTRQTGTNNPFDGITASGKGRISMGDVDGDGDLDLLVGASNGELHYYSADAGGYVELTGGANPFDGISVDYYSEPDLADIDGDGDLDLFVGDKYGEYVYYQNVSGTYTLQTGTANPLDAVSGGTVINPYNMVCADQDADGDLDIYIGNKYGIQIYYENDGGTFTEQTGVDNPYSALDFTLMVAPLFTDIDGDGDVEAFAGTGYGQFWMAESTEYQPPDAVTHNELEGLNIYAAEQTVFIEPGNYAVERVDIFSITGSRVASKTVGSEGSFEIPVGNISSGMYIVKVITSANEVKTTKVMIY
jgi:hypothetical protein